MDINAYIEDRILFYKEKDLIFSQEKIDYLSERGLMPLYTGDSILKMLNFIANNVDKVKDFDRKSNPKVIMEIMQATGGGASPPMVYFEVEKLQLALLEE
jgi:hypothetical protein